MSRTQVTINIIVTDHAFRRAKERLGLNSKAFSRMAMKSFIAGKKHKDCKGQLKKYIDKIWLEQRQANNIRIYGEVLYLFRNNYLITVYQLPNDLKKYVGV
jgi:hypothetical protein